MSPNANPSITPAPATPPPRPPPGPRAFAQGVGVLLQTVGMIMFMSSCCLCSLSGQFDPVIERPQALDLARNAAPQRSAQDADRSTVGGSFAEPARAGAMLLQMFATVGGLCLAAYGLGLQADKPRAAEGATIVAAVLLVIVLVSGWLLWRGGASWAARGWQALLAVVVGVSLAFCIAALRQVRRHPPPSEIEVLPKDWQPPPRRHL